MKQLPVQTKALKNIQDKDQLYLIIGDDQNKVIINIGKKTYDDVTKLITNGTNKTTVENNDKKR
jgi:hypothetical protein